MTRVRVDALPDGPLVLDATRSHHLRVARVSEGDPIALFDGAGREVDARLEAWVGAEARVVPVGAPRSGATVTAIHLVLGLPKGPAADDAIRMATEAGVTAIHPVRAARTQGRPERADRWQRIAESAAAQCGRADVPEVLPVAELADALARLSGVAIAIADPGASAAVVEHGAPIAVLVGPEGGWTDAERDLARARGAVPIGLGPHVLRTPTACAVAVALFRIGRS